MFDSKIRPYIDPPLNAAADALARTKLTANHITLTGFGFSLCAFAALAFTHYGAALCFILASRLMDGLDGALARIRHNESDLGAFLDTVSDFIFYGGFVFFFAVGKPETALAAAFLIFSFMGTASSFLAYAIIAAKRGDNHNRQGKKSFYYLSGITEGSETIIFFVLMCLFPGAFVPLAILFGFLCWLTTMSRIGQAVNDFKNS